jgi:hypothetical protein
VVHGSRTLRDDQHVLKIRDLSLFSVSIRGVGMPLTIW